MKRILLVLLALPVLWFVGRAIVYALVSDETRIRWHVEDMQEGYNSGDIGDAIGPLHSDWTHEGYEFDREMLRAGLVGEFFQDRDTETKKLLRRIDIDFETIEVSADGDEAQLALEVGFSRWDREDEWSEVWSAWIEAELIRTEQGWKILRSRHEDRRGTQLSR